MNAETVQDGGIASAQGKGTTDRCAPLPLTLFGQLPDRGAEPIANPHPRFTRHQLDPCCWVDQVERLIIGADALFDEVVGCLEWEQGQRLMYGRWVAEPRLTSRLELGDIAVPDVVRKAVSVLEGHYERRFTGLFCNFLPRRHGQRCLAR